MELNNKKAIILSLALITLGASFYYLIMELYVLALVWNWFCIFSLYLYMYFCYHDTTNELDQLRFKIQLSENQ